MNSMYFYKDKEQDKALDFIKVLLTDQDGLHNDIHVCDDGLGLIVEWEQVPYDRSYGGQFVFLDEDEEVYKEVRIGDGYYEYMPKSEYEQRLKEAKEKEFKGE